MKIRNARFVETGAIDCEIMHPTFGWIPFTADPQDGEVAGAIIYEAAVKTAKPYVAPPPPTPADTAARLDAMADALITGSIFERALGRLLGEIGKSVVDPNASMSPAERAALVRDMMRAHMRDIISEGSA